MGRRTKDREPRFDSIKAESTAALTESLQPKITATVQQSLVVRHTVSVLLSRPPAAQAGLTGRVKRLGGCLLEIASVTLALQLINC